MNEAADVDDEAAMSRGVSASETDNDKTTIDPGYEASSYPWPIAQLTID